MGRPKTPSPQKGMIGKLGKKVKTALRRSTSFVSKFKGLCHNFSIQPSTGRAQSSSSSLSGTQAAPSVSKRTRSVSLGDVSDAVLWNLFKHCGVKELSQMGQSSRRLYQWLRKFVCSTAGADHFAQVIATASAQSDAFFADLAALLLLCTTGEGCEYRTNLAVQLYAKLQGRAASEDEWGLFISKFCRGWDDAQRFAFMQRFADVQLVSDVTKVLHGMESGEEDNRDIAEELRVRRLVHSLFSYEAQTLGSAEMAFSVSAVMRLLCAPKRRHLLLMLLYAPVVRTANNNTEQVRLPSVDDPEVTQFCEIYEMFGVMPMVCEQLLRTENPHVPELQWTEKEVFEIVEDLTTYPEPWSAGNFAAFLVFRPLLAFIAVGLRAVNDFMPDAGVILFHLIELSSTMGPMCHATLKETMSELARVLPRRMLADLHTIVLRHSAAQVNNAWKPNPTTGHFDRVTLMKELQLSAYISSLFGHTVCCMGSHANH